MSVTYKDGRAYARIGQGQSIDLGGIAKGYIGTALAEDLVAKGMKHGLINLGGNVVAVGEKAPGTPWSIGLQIPGHPRGEPFAIVRVADTSVVTSGAYERYFEKDGKRYAHILSPKTGRPVTTDISSVTIISKDGTFADAWCTALFAMGWDKAREYASRRGLYHVEWRHEADRRDGGGTPVPPRPCRGLRPRIHPLTGTTPRRGFFHTQKSALHRRSALLVSSSGLPT